MVTDAKPGAEFNRNGAQLRLDCPHCTTKSVAVAGMMGFPERPSPGRSCFWIARCNSCDGQLAIALERTETDTNLRVVAVYPHPASTATNLTHTPEGVIAALNEAQTCAAVGTRFASALVCRRALQLIARDRGVQGDLFVAIDKLPIDETLKRAGHAIRLIGNEAAHPNPIEWDVVTDDDIATLIAFTLQIVDQVYEAPARVRDILERAESIGVHPAANSSQ